MVARPRSSHKISTELRSLRLMLGDLPGIAAEWEELPDGERAGWSHDWDQIMGAFEVVLEPAYRAREMNADQVALFEAIRRDLQRALPTIERIGLQAPRLLSVSP
jgi:hypothetical protein